MTLEVDCPPGVELGERGVAHSEQAWRSPTRSAYSEACAQDFAEGPSAYVCSFDGDVARHVRGYQMYSEGGVDKIGWSREYLVAPSAGPAGALTDSVTVRLWDVPSRPVVGVPINIGVSADGAIPPPGVVSEDIGVYVMPPGTRETGSLQEGRVCGSVSGLVPGLHTVRCTMDTSGPLTIVGYVQVPLGDEGTQRVSRPITVVARAP